MDPIHPSIHPDAFDADLFYTLTLKLEKSGRIDPYPIPAILPPLPGSTSGSGFASSTSALI